MYLLTLLAVSLYFVTNDAENDRCHLVSWQMFMPLAAIPGLWGMITQDHAGSIWSVIGHTGVVFVVIAVIGFGPMVWHTERMKQVYDRYGYNNALLLDLGCWILGGSLVLLTWIAAMFR